MNHTTHQNRIVLTHLTTPFGELLAVANANRNNRTSIPIPCHRVIGKSGTITGYGGGLWRKKILLHLEGEVN